MISSQDKTDESDDSTHPPPKLPPKTKSNGNGNKGNVPDVVANAT